MHLTSRPNLSAIPRSIRITGRRVANWWTRAVPNWLQDGLTAVAIALPLWVLLAMTLLVF